MKRLLIICVFILLLTILLLKVFIHPAPKALSNNPDYKFRLGTLFDENAVLQREKPIRIFGKAEPGSKIKLNFAHKKGSTITNADGTWFITLRPVKAGGPYKLKVSNGQETIKLEHVYVGDVWLAAGQSNMVWFVDSVMNAEQNIMQASFYTNKIFFLDIDTRPQERPLSSFEPFPRQWLNTNTDTVKTFSAVAYAFARATYNDQEVPIAMIRVATSNTMIQTHMSPESLVGYKDLDKLKAKALEDRAVWYQTGFYQGTKSPNHLRYFVLCVGEPVHQSYFTTFFNQRKVVNLAPERNCNKLDIRTLNQANIVQIRIFPTQLKDISLEQLTTEIKKSKFSFNGEDLALSRWHVFSEIGLNTPSSNFNARISPLTLYPIKGVLWYQGEANVDDYASYKLLFTALVKDWRQRWGEELPFLTVQLHNFTTPHPENLLAFRKVQYELSQELSGVYMIDAFDLSDKDLNIHAKNKDEVGYRLAAMAKTKVYAVGQHKN